jgi:hypothetical protein
MQPKVGLRQYVIIAAGLLTATWIEITFKVLGASENVIVTKVRLEFVDAPSSWNYRRGDVRVGEFSLRLLGKPVG